MTVTQKQHNDLTPQEQDGFNAALFIGLCGYWGVMIWVGYKLVCWLAALP